MRRIIIKRNTAQSSSNPARYHTHLRLEDNSEPHLKLAGFSYFGEVGGLRHIPEDGYIVLYPDRNTPDWNRVLHQGSTEERIRMTYAQWLAMLAEHRVNLVRVWVFDLTEAASYPFFHTFKSAQYDLNVPSQRYLRRLTRFINLCRRHGIVVHLSLFSDQMVRPAYWPFMPFHHLRALPDPQTQQEYFTDSGRSLLRITDGALEERRKRVEREFVRSITAACRPFWNVMFEIMNEVGVTVPLSVVQPWHAEVARWLNEDLSDGAGGRTHPVTVSVVPEIRETILGDLLVGSTQTLFDIVSLHGNAWGGHDGIGDDEEPPRDPQQSDEEIRDDTRAKLRTLYSGALANRPFAVICDSDAFPRAQKAPDRYARIALRDLNLNYAHRYQQQFLSHAELTDQLITRLSPQIPAGFSFPDPTPRPTPLPAISFEESAVAGVFRHRPGMTATDIGAFRRNSVWVVSNVATGGGFTIHHWNGSAWTQIAGGAVRISVGPNGPWVVNSAGHIYRRSGGGFVRVAGPTAQDIGVGGDGSVWITGGQAVFGGFEIFRFENNAWVRVDGGAKRIAVNPIGMPWVVNDQGAIFARDGNAWIQTPATASDIGVGLDDTAWIIGTAPVGGGFTISYWTGTEWRTIDGGGTNIAVDHDGLPWVTNSAGSVFQREAPE